MKTTLSPDRGTIPEQRTHLLNLDPRQQLDWLEAENDTFLQVVCLTGELKQGPAIAK